MRPNIIIKLIAISLFLTSCSIGPSSLIRQHTYSGEKKSSQEIAIVYGRWDGFSAEMVFACSVDGKSYNQLGPISPCPSVIYLTPGQHEVEVNWRWANRSELKKIKMEFEAGKVYEMTAKHKDVPLAKVEEVELTIVPKPAGYQLHYKELAPVFFNDGKIQDSVVDPKAK